MSTIPTLEDIQSMTEVDLYTLGDMISRELSKRYFNKEKESLSATTQCKNRRIFLIYKPEDKRTRPSTIETSPEKYETALRKLSERLTDTEMSAIRTEVAGIIHTEGLYPTRGYELTLPAFDPVPGIARIRSIISELEQIDPKIDLSTISIRYKFGNHMELARFAKLDMNQIRQTNYGDTYDSYPKDATVYQVLIADHQGAVPGQPQFRSDSVRQILLT